MRPIPKDVIDRIIKQNDIVDIISEYVNLEKKGRNYFGLCPFHSENTPSFSVSPEKQIFRCFSCNEGGNVAHFLAKINNISFLDSIKYLANRINLNINEFFADNKNDESLAKYYALNKFVLEYYQFALHNTKFGEEALKYLHKRNITDDLIKMFNIGLAPDSVDSLYQALKGNNFSELLMLELGHVIKSGNRFYDRFKNRIMFPITDVYGNIVGFSGRTYLTKYVNEPKYINTQETPIFKKNEILYNIYHSQKYIKQNKRVFIFEGFMDVIASYRSGIYESVATMGTALTSNHVELLKRFTNQAVVCFDADEAGVEATKRAINLLNDYKMKVSVVNLPDNLDPDDYVNRYGADKYLEYLNQKQKSYKEYMYENYFRETNINNIESLDNFKRKVFQLLINSTPTEKELFLHKLSNDINVSISTLQFDYKQYTQYIRKSDKPSEFDLINQEAVIKKITKSRPSEKKLLGAQKILCFFCLYNRKFVNIIKEETRINFSHPDFRRLFFDLNDYYNIYDSFVKEDFVENYIKDDEKYLSFFNSVYNDYINYKGNFDEKYLKQCFAVIFNEKIAKVVLELKDKIKSAKDEEEKIKYTEEIISHIKKIKVNK